MELSLIGLQNAGKTSLVNVIAVSEVFTIGLLFFLFLFSCLFQFDADVEISVSGTRCQTGGYSEDMIPTVCDLLFELFCAFNFHCRN